MKCSDYVEWIAEMLDGTLPQYRQRELEEHFAGCSRCRAELLLQKKMLATLVEEAHSGLSPNFTQRVSEHALGIGKARERTQKWAPLIPAFAFAAMAIVVLVFRVEVAQVLGPAMQAFAHGLASPLAWLGERFAAIFPQTVSLPSQHASMLEAASRPLVTILGAAVFACVIVLWALTKALAFLKE